MQRLRRESLGTKMDPAEPETAGDNRRERDISARRIITDRAVSLRALKGGFGPGPWRSRVAISTLILQA